MLAIYVVNNIKLYIKVLIPSGNMVSIKKGAGFTPALVITR